MTQSVSNLPSADTTGPKPRVNDGLRSPSRRQPPRHRRRTPPSRNQAHARRRPASWPDATPAVTRHPGATCNATATDPCRLRHKAAVTGNASVGAAEPDLVAIRVSVERLSRSSTKVVTTDCCRAFGSRSHHRGRRSRGAAVSRLREARLRAGLSQAALGQLAYYANPVNPIYDFESGRGDPAHGSTGGDLPSPHDARCPRDAGRGVA
jgi:hypothetical protein